jgi:hypothetical protein
VDQQGFGTSKTAAMYFEKTFQNIKAACSKEGKGWHSKSCNQTCKM